jgi:hypothetical protein
MNETENKTKYQSEEVTPAEEAQIAAIFKSAREGVLPEKARLEASLKEATEETTMFSFFSDLYDRFSKNFSRDNTCS